MSDVILKVDNLVKHFPTGKGRRGEKEVVKAVDGISFELKAGETYTAHFQLSKNDLGFYNEQMKWIFEPGDFVIAVGGNSDASLKTTIPVK